MNDDLNQRELLNEVLDDAASPEFRAEILGKTLCEVHRRKRLGRRVRVLSPSAVAMALLVVGAMVWFLSKPPVSSNAANPLFIHSEALARQMLVATEPASVDLVHTSDSSVMLLSTSGAERAFEVINDQQLLALLGGRPAALVYRAPAQAELVFCNPSEQNGFPTP